MNRKSRPCYDGQNYGEEEYQKLSNIINVSFTLFVNSFYDLFIFDCLLSRKDTAAPHPLYLGDSEEEPDCARMRPMED